MSVTDEIRKLVEEELKNENALSKTLDSAKNVAKRLGKNIGDEVEDFVGGPVKDAAGEVLKDVRVFREAYRLVGLGWIYAPTSWPVLGPLVDQIYRLWARWRLTFTFRPSLDQLCKARELCIKN